MRCLFFILCSISQIFNCAAAIELSDPSATLLTRNLYRNLHLISDKNTLFGHQDTLAYGVRWFAEEDRSDVKDVSGSYPAVYGWDLLELKREPEDLGEYRMTAYAYVQWTKEVFKRGGVTTFSWHLQNPVTNESFYSKTPAVFSVLPGGENHGWLNQRLDSVAQLFKELDGIPVIFRPWHEHNGDWFWWGKPYCDEEDYRALWRFTVDYLRYEKNLNNVIYAFSPDRSRINLKNGEESYLYGYPGDSYVDIIGLDNYWDVGHKGNGKSAEDQHQDFVKSLELIVFLAEKKKKLAALTETGLEGLKNSKWWTETLLRGIHANEQTSKIAYVQVWRNANFVVEQKEDHFYAPFLGQISASDFVKFKEHSRILFQDELPTLYELSH